MRNLLHANFLRLRKSALFWTVLLLGFGLTAFVCVQQWYEKRTFVYTGQNIGLETVLFVCAALVGLALAVFLPMFFGVETGEGAVRNKLAVGHTRAAFCGAALLTGFAAGAAFVGVSLAAALLFGVPLLGGPTAPVPFLAGALCGILFMTAAFCALFVCITVNCRSRPTAIVLCMLLLIALFVLSVAIEGRLEAPEFLQGYTLGAEGGIELAAPEPNPRYLRGTGRAVYEFLLDLLPTGQAIRYTGLLFGDPTRMIVLAALVAALATGLGMRRFAKKDLR